jgi:elongation factor G
LTDHGNGEETSIALDDKAKSAVVIFKLMTDPFLGELILCRGHAGQLKTGEVAYNPRTRKSERVSRLIWMKADPREGLDVAYFADIRAVIGIPCVVHGDTLCDWKPINIFEPTAGTGDSLKTLYLPPGVDMFAF